MSKKRVFLSFHIDNELEKNLIEGQAKNDKLDLEFINYTVDEPFDEKWKTNCKEKIKKCSVMICLIGEKTAEREAVIWELNKGIELNLKVFGIQLFKQSQGKIYTVPQPLKDNNCKILSWNIEDIQREIENV